MEQLELRFIDAELTSVEGGLKVSGYVNKTNQWSEVLGVRKKFVERILPGTFTRALQAGNEIHFLAEHDNAKILSSTRNSSLQLREDENGLYMEATIAPTSWGKDYHTLITEGIIQNMSFGMKVMKDTWKKMNDGMYERSISDIYLAEVSAVRNPAYVQSTIAARSIEILEDVEVPDEIESENRGESNQMEITVETRDKLVEAIEMLHGLLKDNQAAKEVAPEVKEVVEKAAESVQEVVDVVVESAKEVTEVVAEVVDKVTDKVAEEIEEVAEEVKEVVEVAKEVVEEVIEDVKEAATETTAPDFSKFYKKLLDLA